MLPNVEIITTVADIERQIETASSALKQNREHACSTLAPVPQVADAIVWFLEIKFGADDEAVLLADKAARAIRLACDAVGYVAHDPKQPVANVRRALRYSRKRQAELLATLRDRAR